MAANYRDWTGMAMAANSSYLTGKCGVAANFSRLAVGARTAKYNHWAGAAMDANIINYKCIYILRTCKHMIRNERTYVHTLTLYKEIQTNTFTYI
jgi:hypothetical protein